MLDRMLKSNCHSFGERLRTVAACVRYEASAEEQEPRTPAPLNHLALLSVISTSVTADFAGGGGEGSET